MMICKTSSSIFLWFLLLLTSESVQSFRVLSKPSLSLSTIWKFRRPSTLFSTPDVSSESVSWKGAKVISSKDKDMKPIMTSEQIAKILPHRYPFLLVDRVVEFEPGKKVVGLKSITMNEPQFTGHFPDRPIMPGVLMIEAMAQLGGILCLSPPINNAGPRLFLFAGVNGVRWKQPVVPGDQLVMEMELIDFNEQLGFAKMTGKSYVGGKIAVEVKEFSFALAPN